jgi:MYXO-CTERM domain-containing protein
MRTICLAVLAAFFVGTSHAAQVVFPINANGQKELTGGAATADPDGTAIGTITLDNGTGSGTTGSAILNLTLANINGTLSAHHIHGGAFNTTGSPVIDFGNPNTILTGSPTAGTLSGTIPNLSATTITNIINNPSGFYYNLHSTPDFPGGAVRDQLPEPGLAALALGAIGLLARRRRA